MGVKDLIKKMEELGKIAGETPATTKALAPDFDSPAAPASSIPESTPAPAVQEVNAGNSSIAANSSADNPQGARNEEVPISKQAQPASTASTKPSENGDAASEDPEKKAKKVRI